MNSNVPRLWKTVKAKTNTIGIRSSQFMLQIYEKKGLKRDIPACKGPNEPSSDTF